MKKVADKTNGQSRLVGGTELMLCSRGMKAALLASNSLRPRRLHWRRKWGDSERHARAGGGQGSAIRKTTWLQSRKIETQVNQNWLSEKKKIFHWPQLLPKNTDDFMMT